MTQSILIHTKVDFFLFTLLLMLQSNQRILLDKFKLTGDICAAIAKALKNGKARLVSDGSYFPEEDTGGSAFIISAGKRKDNYLIGFNWFPGTKEDQNLYRSEMVNGGFLHFQ